MRWLFLFFISLSSLMVYAQSSDKEQESYIEGVVKAIGNKEKMEFAAVRLLTESDSSFVKGGGTNDNGYFKILTSEGNYVVEIVFMGYEKYFKNITIDKEHRIANLGEILLKEDGYWLDETVVEGQVPDVLVKGDTIEYNASSFNSEENSVLKDLVQNIPGIEIDDKGNITANGKPVKKILVDGKEFFGNDIELALSNLPANMIKKLQLFKEESETAKITGFKDKNPDQVLNLVVKEELKRSMFGDTRLGYGNKNKHSGRALLNYMQDENQASLVAGMDNVPANDFYIPDNGLDKNKNVGINVYTNPVAKLKVGGHIRYSFNDNELTSNSSTETFLTSGNRMSTSESKNRTKRDNLNTGMNLNWDIDSMTTVYATSYVTYNESQGENYSTNLSFVAKKDSTLGFNKAANTGNAYNINNNMTFGRKLNSKGRNISLSLTHSYRNNDGEGENYSETNYTDGSAQKIIDQQTATYTTYNGYDISVSYVEPFGKEHSLQLNYIYSNGHSKRLRDTWKKDAEGNYTLLDSAYSRNTFSDNINQTVSVNFQGRKEKYNYTIGFNIDPSYSRNVTSLGDSIIDNIKQDVLNYSPTLNFTYNPDPSVNLDLSYSGYSQQPSVTQLSTDTTIVNAMAKYYGNPNLKPSYDNNFSFSYQKSNFEANRFFMIMGGFNYTLNNAVDYTKIDEQGNSVTTFKNVNGDWGANLGVNYNTPLKNKKFTFNTNSNGNFRRNVGYTNSDKAVTKNINLSQQFQLRFKSKLFEATLETGIGHNITRNNLSEIDDRSTSNFNLGNNFLLKLPYDFSIQSNIKYSKYNGYGSDFKSNEVLWNASFNKKILKDKKGTLRMQIFDILDDKNTISRFVSSNYISDSRSNSVSRYMMFSFIYRFTVLQGGAS